MLEFLKITESSKLSGSPNSLQTLKMARSGSFFVRDIDSSLTNRVTASGMDSSRASDSWRMILRAVGVRVQKGWSLTGWLKMSKI